MIRVGHKITYIFLTILMCLSILSSCKSSPKLTKSASIPLNSTTLKNSEQTKVYTNINNNTTKKSQINLSKIGNETNTKIVVSNNNTITKLQTNNLKTKNESNVTILKSKKLPPLKLTSNSTLKVKATKKLDNSIIIGKEKKIHILHKPEKIKSTQKISKSREKKGTIISVIKNATTPHTKLEILNKKTKRITRQINSNKKNDKYIVYKNIKKNLEKKAKSHKKRETIILPSNNKKQKILHKIVKKATTQRNIKTNKRLETIKAEKKEKLYTSNIKTNKTKKELTHKKLNYVKRVKSKENKKYIQNHLNKKITKNKKKISPTLKLKRESLKAKENQKNKVNNQNKSKKETSKANAKEDIQSKYINKSEQIYSKNNKLHKLMNNKKQNNVVSSNNNHEYIIGPGDVLDVEVWKEPQLSAKVPVRPDGKITLPLINDIQAAGRTPLELRAAIQKALSKYLENPVVSVSVLGVNKKFFILGKVNAPGEYPLNSPITVLQAIALAKGFADWADTKHIIILRQLHGKQIRLKFNYDDVAQGKHLDENIYLKPGDTIIVP